MRLLGIFRTLYTCFICIAAFGAGQEGVSFYLQEKVKELKKAMILTGCGSIDQIDPSIIFRKKGER